VIPQQRQQTEAEGAEEAAKPPSRVIGREKKHFSDARTGENHNENKNMKILGFPSLHFSMLCRGFFFLSTVTASTVNSSFNGFR
jgi:hypothetical protein